MNTKQNDKQHQHCLMLAEQLNIEYKWGMSTLQLQNYALFLATWHGIAEDTKLCVILKNYHADHRKVSILLDSAHPDYDKSWEQLYSQIARIIHTKIPTSLRYMLDGNLDDVVQVTVQDVLNGLPRFHYESRLETWVFVVVSRGMMRYYRALKARKRVFIQAAVSIDAMSTAEDDIIDEQAQPETIALEQSLLDLINRVLQAQCDSRLYPVFMLSVLEQEPLRMISQRLSLSPARVLALLRQSVEMLKNDQVIQDWFRANELHSVSGA